MPENTTIAERAETIEPLESEGDAALPGTNDRLETAPERSVSGPRVIERGEPAPKANATPRWLEKPHPNQRFIRQEATAATSSSMEEVAAQYVSNAQLMAILQDIQARLERLEGGKHTPAGKTAAGKPEGESAAITTNDAESASDNTPDGEHAELEQALADAETYAQDSVASAKQAVTAAEDAVKAAKTPAAKKSANAELTVAKQELEEIEQLTAKQVAEARSALEEARTANPSADEGQP